jgi:hypothetical protein
MKCQCYSGRHGAAGDGDDRQGSGTSGDVPEGADRGSRRREGGGPRGRVQAAGVKTGRPPKLDPFQRREALKRLKAGESPHTIGRSYGGHRSTIERLAA